MTYRSRISAQLSCKNWTQEKVAHQVHLVLLRSGPPCWNYSDHMQSIKFHLWDNEPLCNECCDCMLRMSTLTFLTSGVTLTSPSHHPPDFTLCQILKGQERSHAQIWSKLMPMEYYGCEYIYILKSWAHFSKYALVRWIDHSMAPLYLCDTPRVVITLFGTTLVMVQ